MTNHLTGGWSAPRSPYRGLPIATRTVVYTQRDDAPLPDLRRAGTGGRDFVYADSSKSARLTN